MRALSEMASVPCKTCPWRKSSTVGGADIPGFSIELMQGLSNTVGPGDDFRPIMVCHGTEEGNEHACIGYVAVEGYSNINVRLEVLDGKINFQDIDRDCAGIEMWDSFTEMLEAYEEAQC